MKGLRKHRRLLVLFSIFVVLAAALVWYRRDFKRSLVAVVSNADRVEVAVQRYTESDDDKSAPFVLKGGDKIKELLNTLDFQFSLGWSHCMCLGDTVFEFYEGDDKLATVTYHHGTHMRWHGGPWGTDVYLTPNAQVQLASWFKEQGYDRLQALRDERLAEEQREADETAKFYSFFPNSRIGTLSSEPRQLAQAVFRAFSATSLSWSTTGGKEREAIEALSRITDSDLLAALPEITNDTEALLGFARFFFFDDYDEKIPQAERDEWSIRLAKVVLKDGNDEDKPLVMRHLRHVKTPATDELLQAIVQGSFEVPRQREVSWREEPAARAEAALCLAIRGNTGIKEHVQALLQKEQSGMDRAALELALATLGDPTYLKKEHFGFDSYSLGYAGLAAIEQYRGAYGMDALVNGAFEHSWAAIREEAVVVFERITGHVVWNRAPHSRSSWYIDDAVAWWEANGENFVRERRAAFEQQYKQPREK